MFRDDLAGRDADHRGFAVGDGNAEVRGVDGPGLDAIKADRFDGLARGEKLWGHLAPSGKDEICAAVFEAVDDHEVCTPAGGYETAVPQAEGTGSRDRLARRCRGDCGHQCKGRGTATGAR